MVETLRQILVVRTYESLFDGARIQVAVVNGPCGQVMARLPLGTVEAAVQTAVDAYRMLRALVRQARSRR